MEDDAKPSTGALPEPSSFSFSFWASRDFTVKAQTDVYLKLTGALTQERKGVFLTNHLTCLVPDFDSLNLSEGARSVFTTPNAGGNSEKSEALSFELMYRCFRAELFKTEMEIEYFHQNWKRTDYSVRMRCAAADVLIGVSVTRAYKHVGEYAIEDATHLLTKKLNGVNWSTIGVSERDAWFKQILHVWAPTQRTAQLLRSAYDKLDSELVSNTIVLVTVDRNANWIYKG